MKFIRTAFFLLLLVLAPARAFSQALVCPDPGKDIEQNKTEARRYFELGSTYFDMKQFDKSAEAFACVIKLVPYTVTARYRLAVSYDRLGKLELAREQYQWVMVSTSKEAEPLKIEVKKRLDEIRKLEEEKVAAAKAEADRLAKAEADKKARAEAEAKAREDARLKAEADKKAREEADRKAREDARMKAEADRKAKAEADRKAKEDARIKAEADRKARAADGASTDPPATGSAPRLTSRWWFWTGLGATALLAGTATVMGGLAIQEKQEYEKNTFADADAKSRYETYLLVGDLALGGTLLSAAALGVAIWLWKPEKKLSDATSGIWLVPACGAEGCMMTLSVGF